MEDAFLDFVVIIVVMVPLWRAFDRAGLNTAKTLWFLVPGVGFLIVLRIFANSEWPRVKPAGERP